jgi:hypothetical protein
VKKYDEPINGLTDANFMTMLRKREREYLELRGLGYPVMKIPAEMGISWRGIWGYRVRVYRKWMQWQNKEVIKIDIHPESNIK